MGAVESRFLLGDIRYQCCVYSQFSWLEEIPRRSSLARSICLTEMLSTRLCHLDHASERRLFVFRNSTVCEL